MKSRKKHASFILCTMLIVAMAFAATGCNGSTKKETPAADIIDIYPNGYFRMQDT